MLHLKDNGQAIGWAVSKTDNKVFAYDVPVPE
jgi:hypothetical protein